LSVVVDTHVLLWWRAGERLSRRATRELARAEKLLVSPIVFWEVAVLLSKGRIELDRDLFEWISDVLGEEQVELAPLSAQAAGHAGLLPLRGFGGDQADCLIYATAREAMLPLVTKDRALHDFAQQAKDVRAVW
jgi:PIN domain nuclease of toxin-antitoxin system